MINLLRCRIKLTGDQFAVEKPDLSVFGGMYSVVSNRQWLRDGLPCTHIYRP